MKLNKVKTYDTDFTRTYNEVIQDSSLSWKARGIFIYLWSLPDTKDHPWKYREKIIARRATDGLSSLNTGIKELRRHHYILIKRSNDGTTHWYISDHKLMPHSEKPNVENPNKEKPNVENPHVLQTTNHNKQSISTNNQSPTIKMIEQKMMFDFKYYKNGLHARELPDYINQLSHRFPIKIIDQAVKNANDYQLAKGTVNYPPRFIKKTCVNILKHHHKEQLHDDGFVDNSHVDMMKKARKQTRRAVARLKKEGKL